MERDARRILLLGREWSRLWRVLSLLRIDLARQTYEARLKLLYSIFLVFPLRIRRLCRTTGNPITFPPFSSPLAQPSCREEDFSIPSARRQSGTICLNYISRYKREYIDARGVEGILQQFERRNIDDEKVAIAN